MACRTSVAEAGDVCTATSASLLARAGLMPAHVQGPAKQTSPLNGSHCKTFVKLLKIGSLFYIFLLPISA